MKGLKTSLVLWGLLLTAPVVMAEATADVAGVGMIEVIEADDGTVEFLIDDSVIGALRKQCVVESKEDKVVEGQLEEFMEICMAVKVEEQMDLAYAKAVADAEAEAKAEAKK